MRRTPLTTTPRRQLMWLMCGERANVVYSQSFSGTVLCCGRENQDTSERRFAQTATSPQQQHPANPAPLQSPHDDSVTTQTPPVIRPADDAFCGDGGGVSATIQYHTIRDAIGNESVPIQLAQCRFPGLAISNAKILIYFFPRKYTEAILSNSLVNCYGLKVSECCLTKLFP